VGSSFPQAGISAAACESFADLQSNLIALFLSQSFYRANEACAAGRDKTGEERGGH
jgi:hypothetical protein